jgi:peptidoglycan/xylan/chitin deacetylase (PgdA/CDA1 family)
MLAALTLDDNWDEEVLDILDETHIVVTLFPCGHHVKHYPQSFIERCSRHEIGNHTFDHSKMTEIGNSEGRRQIELANRIIEDRVGVTPKIFAYPYGSHDKRVCDLVRSCGFLAARTCQVQGSIFNRWRLPTHTWVEWQQEKINKLPPYLIIGAHPFEVGPKKLKQFILRLQGIGTRFVTVSNLIRMGNMV